MSKRLWLLGLVGLLLVGLLVACGSNYNSSQDGLLLVGSQGSSVIETFSFTLSNGHVSPIANSPNDTGNQTCVLNGLPSSMVVTPSGSYAYVIFNTTDICPKATQAGIATFQVKSDGSISQTNFLADANPVALSMDPAGKFLFVAEGSSTTSIQNYQTLLQESQSGQNVQVPACVQTAGSPGAVPPISPQYGICVYSIGSNGSLTNVAQTFVPPNTPLNMDPSITALAPSPTVFPSVGVNGTVNSVCSVPGTTPPTSQFLYAVDAVNYTVWELQVDTTSGVLGYATPATAVNVYATDKVPMGVAVDPCDRFVYVSDSQTNKISAYLLCSTVILPNPCPYADGSLVPVVGSPFSLSGSANTPGPIAVDPFGNFVYTVGMKSNTVSGLAISPVSGGLRALNPPTIATGHMPISMTIRPDDNWMFVTNFGDATVSQYSITPANGALTVEAPIQTDNQPFGVAVK